MLDVRNNDITNEAQLSLTKVMLQIYTLTINLSGNPIFDDKPSMTVFDTIIKLREGQVPSIVCDGNSSSHIECQSIVYVMECNHLENLTCFKSFNSIITVEILKFITDSKFDYGVKILEYLYFLLVAFVLRQPSEKLSHVATGSWQFSTPHW